MILSVLQLIGKDSKEKKVDCPKSQTPISNAWLRDSKKLITGLMQTRAADGENRGGERQTKEDKPKALRGMRDLIFIKVFSRHCSH